MKRTGFFLAAFCAAMIARGETVTNDIVIYGGTSAGVIAAVQAKKMGKSVVVVAPEKHLGGLTSGGLGYTDIGNKNAIGGLGRDFYKRVWKKYADDAAWKFEKRKPFGAQGASVEPGEETQWIFEPHVAEQVFEDLVAENKIEVLRGERLDLKDGVTKDGARIVSFRTESGKVFAGREFIDATYEGDLMAKAGVAYTVGREANAQYGEQFDGVAVKHSKGHQFPPKISAYKIEGDPYSGVLPRIGMSPPAADGTADRRVQAYCFRMCLTDEPENRVPFAKPKNYDAGQYELMLRLLKSGWNQVFGKFDRIPNRKTDTNNHGPFSTDNIGMNYEYPDGDYATREKIIAEHRSYEAGWFYFLANDPRVSEGVRTNMARWGLAKDEFTDNGNWPQQLYVREARRMIGEVVMTEHHCTGKKVAPDSVGLAAYGMDSHNVERYVDADGFVHNEGNVQEHVAGPYPISYRAIVPKKSECENLLVPVCLSATHIAYGSIRMEPVFMILGQSAATAAAMALDEKCAAQDVPYETLKPRLLADAQILSRPAKPARK